MNKMPPKAAFRIDYMLDGTPMSGCFPESDIPPLVIYNLAIRSMRDGEEVIKFMFEYIVSQNMKVDTSRVKLVNYVRIGEWIGAYNGVI